MTPASLRASQLWSLIMETAERFQLQPALVGAVVLVESGGEPLATRFEPQVFFSGVMLNLKTRRPPTCSLDTEKALQASSFGLMQVMGFNARAQGFAGWLTELTRPEIGLDQGCRLLAGLLKRWPRIEDAVSAYNQGSPRRAADGQYANQHYVNLVMADYRGLTS